MQYFPAVISISANVNHYASQTVKYMAQNMSLEISNKKTSSLGFSIYS
jgi:hypothetical protein